jgi:hypothetical protein
MTLGDEQLDHSRGALGVVVTYTYDASMMRPRKRTTNTSASNASGKPLPAVGQIVTFVYEGPLRHLKQTENE